MDASQAACVDSIRNFVMRRRATSGRMTSPSGPFVARQTPSRIDHASRITRLSTWFAKLSDIRVVMAFMASVESQPKSIVSSFMDISMRRPHSARR